MAVVYVIKTKKLSENRTAVAFASSDAAARQARRNLAEEYALDYKKEVSYEAVDIPTNKTGLIDWLNTNVRVLVDS